jgi:hypothetical protein
MDIVFSPTIYEAELKLLQALIHEHLEMHVSLFDAQRIKNKHHHMVHYPHLIREFGLLVRYWCMCFEAKHQRAKRLMHVTGNFKNMLLTVATRHQYHVAHRLLAGSISQSDVALGSGTVVYLVDYPNGEELSVCLGNIGLYCELYQANTSRTSCTFGSSVLQQ